MKNLAALSLSTLLLAGAGASASSVTKIKGSDLVVNGESFFAASNITSELTRLARADGVIGSGESFRQVAVSGASISQILNQFKNANPKPIYLISDGGGIDMMQSCGGTPTTNCAVIKNALNTLQQYFTEMKNSGVKRVLWMRYPDPIGSNWATLKANHDVYNPEVEKVCKASVEPKCLWVDLRTTWGGKTGYTEDGIHCTNAGGTATAEAFWKAIKENDFFNLGAPTSVAAPGAAEAPFLRGRTVQGRTLTLSLSLERPQTVTARIRTLSGKTVLAARSEAQASADGLRSAQFPLGAMQPGVYSLDVQAGASAARSLLLVP